MQVINLQQVPATYPQIMGGSPNGMQLDFVRVNFYIVQAGIFWQFQRKVDVTWVQEIALPVGYFSFDRNASAIQFRSQSSVIPATITVELIEPLDMPPPYEPAIYNA